MLDDNSGGEDYSEDEFCPFCNGEGITYSQDMNDEEDKDFKQCPHCRGSGINPEEVENDTIED